MKTGWQTDTGHLVCRWSEAGQRVQHQPSWTQETSNMQSSYMPPLILDVARYSPFGTSWFRPDPAHRCCE
jgi:hypothetical protein